MRNLKTVPPSHYQPLLGLFRHTHLGMALISHVGEIVETNSGLKSLLGYQEADMLGQNLLCYSHQDDHRCFLGLFSGVLTGQSNVKAVECRFIHKEGYAVWVRLTISCAIEEGNLEPFYFLIFENISRHIETERSLETQSVLLEGVFQESPEALILVDNEKRIIRVNNAFTQIFCYRQEAVLGKHFSMLEGRFSLDFESLLNDGPDYLKRERAIMAYRYQSGEVFAGETVMTPITNGKQREIATLIMIRDVSAQLNAETELRQAGTIFDSTSEGVMVIGLDKTIVNVNQAYTYITGYEKFESISRPPHFLFSGEYDDHFYTEIWNEVVNKGVWQGEIRNRRKGGQLYPEWLTLSVVRNSSGRITHYVGIFSDISKLKKSQEQLEFIAHHDDLTKLPNRLLFNARLEHAIKRAKRNRQLIAVMFLDLDRFKQVNDSLGHSAGDRLLVEVANRLTGQLREGDTVARLGGDEFTLLIEALDSPMHAARLAQKINAALVKPFQFSEQDYFISGSIGISFYPKDGEDIDTLLMAADAAMYQAKNKGKNGYQFYTQQMTHKAFEQLKLESQLRKALDGQEFSLYFQPQVSIESESVIGVEALLRWNHPSDGVVLPGNFIGVAEENGLIVPIGEWVVFEACRQATQWLAEGVEFGKVSVNISELQLQRSDIVKTVKKALKATGLPANLLELELTESVFMSDPDRSIEILTALRELGVHLAVDDFGTGYSSLAYLKRLPIQKLKIDQSFIRDLPNDDNDAAIARAVITLAHSLRISVIAEGVETSEQLAFLKLESCDEAQGFLYSRPVPSDKLTHFLQSRKACH